MHSENLYTELLNCGRQFAYTADQRETDMERPWIGGVCRSDPAGKGGGSGAILILCELCYHYQCSDVFFHAQNRAASII